VESRLAKGDPATEIVRAADSEHADLVAMATHGHRLVKDIILGATVDKVRHLLKVPVLLLQSRH
jgi:nucleotide-binding universal stress UspA family protein